jgi:hypothetical protein
MVSGKLAHAHRDDRGILISKRHRTSPGHHTATVQLGNLYLPDRFGICDVEASILFADLSPSTVAHTECIMLRNKRVRLIVFSRNSSLVNASS